MLAIVDGDQLKHRTLPQAIRQRAVDLSPDGKDLFAELNAKSYATDSSGVNRLIESDQTDVAAARRIDLARPGDHIGIRRRVRGLRCRRGRAIPGIRTR